MSASVARQQKKLKRFTLTAIELSLLIAHILYTKLASLKICIIEENNTRRLNRSSNIQIKSINQKFKTKVMITS